MKRTDPGYWEWRKNPNRRKKISTPKKLWVLACEYFENVDENPWIKQEVIKSGDLAGTIMRVPTTRPYTWAGFSDYLAERGIISDIEDYRYNRDKDYNDYQGIIEQIDRIIRDQKYTGAVVGSFNSSIIIRDLGLVDKTKTTIDTEQPLFGEPSRDS